MEEGTAGEDDDWGEELGVMLLVEERRLGRGLSGMAASALCCCCLISAADGRQAVVVMWRWRC